MHRAGAKLCALAMSVFVALSVLCPASVFAAEALRSPSDGTNTVEVQRSPADGTDTAETSDALTGTFTYRGTDGKDHNYTYSYDENWFAESSYTYNHDMAKMALRLCMAGFDRGPDKATADESVRAANIIDLMSQLGYGSESSAAGGSALVYHYPVSEKDSIGYCMGSKTLADGSKAILLVVRSAGYGAEWGGNMEIGKAGEEGGLTVDHEGFRTAADQVIGALQDYISTNAISGADTKIWVTGYSRGAATANLIANSIDDGKVTMQSGTFRTENVYADCFECPRDTRDANAGDALYGNIHNIINSIDIVTEVAMQGWDFSRYGIDYYLPSAVTASDYGSLKTGMQEAYKGIVGSWGTLSDAEVTAYVEKNTSETAAQGEMIRNCLQALTEYVGSTGDYVDSFQDDLSDILAKGMGSADYEIEDIVDEIFTGNTAVLIGYAIAYPICAAQLTKLFAEDDDFDAHYPELCLAWTDSLPTLQEGDYTEYQSLTLKGDLKAKVTSSGTTFTVYTTDSSESSLFDQFGDYDKSYIAGVISTYMNEEGNMVIVLPADASCKIEVIAGEAGKITCDCELRDLDAKTAADTVVSSTSMKFSAGSGKSYQINVADGKVSREKAS